MSAVNPAGLRTVHLSNTYTHPRATYTRAISSIMVQYKLLAFLVVGSLLTINWRASNTRTVTASIPDSADPKAVLTAIHDQVGFIRLNPVVTTVRQVDTEPEAHNDEWFNTAEADHPINTYRLGNAIKVIPGIGSWGEKQIEFGTWLRNTATGIKTKADAPFGVTVRSHYRVKKDDFSGWVLEVERIVECSSLVMPFVTRTYDKVHADVIRDLIAAGTR
ncbi:hypothetical protein BJY04DRAFT_222476 [Aspergillus karnatakaensis]|uniref:uncharacterized protein n=1 Tax=Aspergillus karnatakaensis TaxID=1810916 RepID=UPI003CCCD3A2